MVSPVMKWDPLPDEMKQTSGSNFWRRESTSESGRNPSGRTTVSGPVSPFPHRLVTSVTECLEFPTLFARASFPALQKELVSLSAAMSTPKSKNTGLGKRPSKQMAILLSTVFAASIYTVYV